MEKYSKIFCDIFARVSVKTPFPIFSSNLELQKKPTVFAQFCIIKLIRLLLYAKYQDIQRPLLREEGDGAPASSGTQ